MGNNNSGMFNCRFVLAATIFFCIACNTKKDKVLGAEIIASMPMFCVADTTSIYYINDTIIYQLPYGYSSSLYGQSLDLTKQETRYRYFMFINGADSGLMYDPSERMQLIRLKVDSIDLHKGFSEDGIYKLSLSDSFNRQQVNNDAYKLSELYLPKSKPSQPSPDTIMYNYSDQLNWLHFSFSPKLDSCKHVKLSKAMFITNAYYDAAAKMEVPRIENVFEIRQKTSVDVTALRQILAKFNM